MAPGVAAEHEGIRVSEMGDPSDKGDRESQHMFLWTKNWPYFIVFQWMSVASVRVLPRNRNSRRFDREKMIIDR